MYYFLVSCHHTAMIVTGTGTAPCGIHKEWPINVFIWPAVSWRQHAWHLTAARGHVKCGG